jgi:hypothetical protein
LILSNLGNINQSPEKVISTLADAFSNVGVVSDEKSKVDFVKEKFSNDYEKQESPEDKKVVEQKAVSLDSADTDEDYEKDNDFDDDDEIKEVALDAVITFDSADTAIIFEPQNLNKADVDNEVLSFSKDIFKDNVDVNFNEIPNVDSNYSSPSFNDNVIESFDNDFLNPLMQASLNKAEEISDVQIPANVNAVSNNGSENFNVPFNLGQNDFTNKENQDMVQRIIAPVISKQGENLEHADFFVPAPENQNEPLSFSFGQDSPLKTEEMSLESLAQDVPQAQEIPQDVEVQKAQKENANFKTEDFFGVNKQASQLSEDLNEVLGETQNKFKVESKSCTEIKNRKILLLIL